MINFRSAAGFAIIVLVLTTCITTSYSQYFVWGRNAGSSSGNESSAGVSTDTYGNAYYTGKFQSSALFPNNQTYVSNGSTDIFVSKINAQGNTIWVKTAGGSNIDEGTAVAVDAQGNVYATGFYSGTASFGNQNITAAGNTDAFLVKYNNAGNLIWVVSAGGNDSDKAKSVAVDAAGNVYISGSYINSATFGNITVNCSGPGVFLAKYNSAGQIQWVRSSTSAPYATGNDIAISGTTVYMVGNFFNTITFGSVILESSHPRPPIQGFVVAYDNSGNILWGKTQNSGFGQSWFYGCAADASGNVFIAGKFDSNIQLDAVSVTTSGLQDAIFIKYNSAGVIQWAKAGGGATGHEGAADIKVSLNQVYAAGFLSNISSFGMFTVAPNGGGNDIFVTSLEISTGNFTSALSEGGYNSADLPFGIAASNQRLYIAGVTGPATYGYDTLYTNGESPDALIAAMSINSGTRSIGGRVYKDVNNNNTYETNEPVVPNHFINVSNTGGFSSNYASGYIGNYMVNVISNPNPYSLTLPYPLLYHTYTPVNPQIIISGSTFFALQNFAYHVIPNMQDLQVSVTPLVNFPRPGFGYSYQITYKNVGTVAVSSNIRMDFDLTKMSYSSSSGGGVYIPATNYVTWNYSNLQPGETRIIYVYYSVYTSTPLGSYINTTTTVNPVATDQTGYNNVAVNSDRVRGSYDPNDKACSHDTVISPQEISRQDSLVYTIRFQNTGTAEAVNIYVADTISSSLELASLNILSSSHSMEMAVEDNNRVTFIFENIMLPDSNANEPQSHGFIKYSIKPKNNLAIGTVISNTAYIYFDFNAPVITNTTYNRVDIPTGTTGQTGNIPYRYELYQNYPNPFNPATTIKYDLPEATNVKLTVYDLLGREAAVLTNGMQPAGYYEVNLDASALASGVYFYKLETPGFTSIKKMVIIK
ncbi:MAG: T9SS type A sorting domain-containing protein [Ignavibacteria bacterium]|nr:T9SS type A sorting domain-containing protein [Ignavibacteria bacterium]